MKWNDLTAEERKTWCYGPSIRAIGEHGEHAVARLANELIAIAYRAGRELAAPDAWAIALRDFLARRRASRPVVD